MVSGVTSPLYKVENLGRSTRITITPQKNVIDFIYSGAKSLTWIIGEVVFLIILYLSVGGFLAKTLGFDILWFSASDKGSVDTFLGVFSLVCITIWTVSGYGMARAFLWQLTGKEILEVSRDGIHLSRPIFGFGKVKEYRANEIIDLRILEDSERTKKKEIAGPNMLVFDYEFGTVEFGGGLTIEEAKDILDTIMKNNRQYDQDR
jgi:hypothetical protein